MQYDKIKTYFEDSIREEKGEEDSVTQQIQKISIA